MKKIYSFVTLAVLGGLASFAGQRYQATTLSLNNAKAELAEKAAVVSVESAKPAKAAAKVVAMADLNGTYDWGFKSLLSNSPKPELVITVDDEATGAATISGLPQGYTVSATIDLKANTLSIANMQNLGTDSNGDINYFYLKPVTEAGNLGEGASTAKATVGTINGNTITFPALDIWAIGDPTAEDLGWWSLTLSNELTLQTEKILYGVGTISGDMFFSAFGKTASDYDVEVYTDEFGKQLLVKTPLKGVYAAFGWETSENPDMIVDVTDPENILIKEFSLGINGGDEDGMYYGMSNSANQTDIANTPATYRITLTKDEKTAVINIPTKALFLWPSNTTSLYYANKTPITITIDVENAGVDGIAADDVNAPVEYFNLQGMRVDNPAAGQFVIKRQGSKVEKIIVR